MALILFLVSLALMLIPQAYAEDIAILSFTSNPVSPTDSPGIQAVTLRCQVNLPAADITSVIITDPIGFVVTITSPSSGSWYETTLSDVHRSDAGTYTCQASSTTQSASADYLLTVVCADDFYGVLCNMSCNCVAGGSCNQDSGFCTCTAAFTGAVCDRDNLDILVVTSDPLAPTDSSSVDNVKLRCRANLPDTNIMSVSMTYPGNSANPMTHTSNGWYEVTLTDVHPSNSGIYTCTVTPTGSLMSTQDTYQLTITDINECDSMPPAHTCSSNAVCGNTDGGFTCTCNAGFSGDGTACTDINECDSMPPAHSCSSNAVCGNTDGGFTCTCNAGFSGDGTVCTDINECDSMPPAHSCSSNAVCGNTDGGFTCTCNAGFSGDGTVCTDVNECDITSPAYPCNSNAVCDNTDGAFTCTCNAGFSGNGHIDGTACTVCMTDYYGDQCMSRCTCVSSGNPMCNNVDGSCTCVKLFDEATCNKENLMVSSFEPMSGDAPVRDDASVNDVVMQCRVNLAESDLSSVTITILSSASIRAMTKVQEGLWAYTIADVHPRDSGVYTCTATATATTGGDIYNDDSMYNLIVEDVDECQENKDNCHEDATCTNDAVDGGFDCTCFSGFSGNGVECTDINECDTSVDNCHGDATCNNTVGSFSCTCNDGFTGDGIAACTACVPGKYGSNCAEDCTCVVPIPGQNDVTCSNVDGTCTCNNAEFTDKTCDKKKLDVTLVPDPNPVLDTTAMDNITWQCRVNLHSRDLALPVSITYPSSASFPMLMNGEGLYEMTLYDVMPTNNGTYTCSASASGMQPVTGIFDLEVLVVGRIISVSDPVEGEVGGTVQIICTVYTSAGTNISWFIGSNDDNPIANSAKYRITETNDVAFEQISYLDVSNLIPADNGTYLCKAQNTEPVSLDTKEVEIIIIEEPVIGGFRLSALKSDEILAEWGITFDGNLPPPDCTVEYRTLNGAWMPSAGSPVTDVTHTLTGLLPYTDYDVQVHCSNKVGMSNTIEGGPQTTLQSNPSKPLNLNAVTQPRSFGVTWDEPAVKNGQISKYLVNVTNTDGVVIKESEETQLSSQIDSLLPYMDYIVVVTAVNTEMGQDLVGTPSDTLTVRTEQDAPSAPVNVQSVDEPTSCDVSWDKPENENGVIQSYRVTYRAYPRSPSGTDTQPDITESVEIDDGTRVSYSFNKSGLASFSGFQFTVGATTVSQGDESYPSNGSCITYAAAPPEPETPTPTPGEDAITSTTFTMSLNPANERNGPISCYDIIVKELLEGEEIDNMDPDRDYPQGSVKTYGYALDNAGIPFVAVVKRGEDVSEMLNVKIGEGRVSRCGGTASNRKKRQAIYDHTGDNGGLKYETRYTAFVRAFVKVENGEEEMYTSSPFMNPITTAQGPSVAGIVIGVILAILIIAVLVLGMLIYMKRRKKFPLLHDRENGVVLEPMKETEPEITHMVVLPIPMESLFKVQEVTHMVVLPIALEDLPEKVKQKCQNDDEIFKNEFKSIPESTGTITKEASKEEYNREKNRYINIVAYDQTRVMLSPIDDVEGSDYINACYVDGYEKLKKFIASQGPREDTVLDFWRMIWEQNCSTIIMLTKCLENGREKCAEYWPEEDAIMYDDIIVTLDDVVTCADYVIRKFTMQKSIEAEEEDDEPIVGERRTLMQFHFLGWPDFGIPKYPHSMLCFVKRIRHMVGSRIEPGNIVVHCSAGVGRTGTYILIDSMLDMMMKERKVNIYNVIYNLRSQRNLLVQSLVQYIFIHKALMEEYLYGHTEVDVGSLHVCYQKICAKNPDGELTGVETEYRTVASLPVENTDQKTGNIEPNKQKNRLRQIIPYDRNRVKLERLTGQEHSNYVNASFIDGYEHKKAYIAAQGPLPNTMGDFWRLAWENQCSTIVMLTQCEEKGQNVCSKYWPDTGDTANHAFLSVSIKDQKEGDEDYTIRDLEVSTTKGAGTKLIRQYHYHGWPEVGTPEISASLVKVIGLAHDYQHDIGRFPILVHCSAGSGRTGVFIALSYLLQRAKAEGLVDVFQTVRTLRQQRPHMVQDVAQYQFCYRAMMEYLDSFDHYANFK